MTQAIVIEAKVGWLDITPEDRDLKAGQIVDVLGWVSDHAGLKAVVAVYEFDADDQGSPDHPPRPVSGRFRAVEVGLLEPLL